MSKKEPNEPSKKEKIDKIIFSFLRRIKLRHMAFLLVAVVALALTTAVIIVLLRISSFRITGLSSSEPITGNDYIGIIGVLVAMTAAFIGALATIMFGNTLYSAYISKQAEEKVNRHEKTIPDLYVLILHNEASECEKEGNILRAIECRIGVVYYVLKARYSSRSDTINYYLQALNKTVKLLNIHNIIAYYTRQSLDKKWIIKEITDYRTDIHGNIADLNRLEMGILVTTPMKTIKDYVDKQVKEAIDILKSEDKIPNFGNSNDYLMRL